MSDQVKVTFKGEPIEVTGNTITKGAKVPEFRLTGTDMADVTNAEINGKIAVISVVPSLDTPVCAMQTRRFNLEAAKLGDNVVVLTVSRDLPFAQKRWCGAEGVSVVKTASDYKYHNFGQAFGVELPTLGLLARSVFVVDKQGTVQYVEYVPEVAQEPDYDGVLKAIKALQ